MFRMYVTVTRLSNNRLPYLGDQDLMTSPSSSPPLCQILPLIPFAQVGCELRAKASRSVAESASGVVLVSSRSASIAKSTIRPRSKIVP